VSNAYAPRVSACDGLMIGPFAPLSQPPYCSTDGAPRQVWHARLDIQPDLQQR